MITKRTRALSFLAVAMMLVSMFACFVIPASAADGDGVAAIKAMYADVLANASADADGALAAALAAEYADAASATTALSAAAAGVTLNDGVKPRTSYYDAYIAAGYTGNSWSISDAADWTYMTTTQYGVLSQGYMYYYVTNDIDFAGAQMTAPGIFRGYVYGQNHTFKNINIVESNAGGENAGLGLVGRTHWAADQGTHAVGFENLTITGTMSYTSTGAAFGGTFVGNHQNGTFVLKNCTSKVNVTFTASGSGSIKFGGLVGRANGGDITGSEFAGTMTVKNSTSVNPYVGGIIGYADGIKDIKGNTFSGTLNYTTTVNSVDDFVGGIVGYVASTAAGQAVIDACAFTGMINDTSAVATAGITNKGATGGIVGYMGSANNIVNNCYSIGTIVTTGGSATSLGYLHNAGKYYNSIGAGVMISGGGLVANSALKSHSNIGASDAASVYAVNMNLAFFKGDSSVQAATATANSAAEAAYKLNSNYNTAGGTQTYFTMKDGKIAFGTEANQIRKVTIIRGEQTFDAYAAQGTVALADVIPGYADAAAVSVTQTVGGYNVAVNDGKINMTGDVTVTVTDTAESAKAALEAAEELGWESVDLPMFTETAAWLDAAATLAEGTDVAAILAKAAELKGIVAGTLTVKADATRPRAKKDAYKNLGITGDGWAVTNAEDWFALIDAKDQFGSKNIVVYKDIDFKNRPMKPIQDGNAFNASLLGNGHVFKNINITHTVASAGLNHGGGLISRANGTATQVISNLGLTGTINYTVTGIEASRAARFGVLVGNNTATIENCWADVDANVTIAGDTTAEIGGLVAYTGNAPITNCSFDGTLNVTVATKSEGTYIGGVVGSAVGGAVTNCTADGEITVNAKNCAHKFWAGGVVGSSNKDVVGCVNSATLKVYGWSGDEYIGGIIGRAHANTVYKCLNQGDLWSDAQSNGNNGIGGIVGGPGSAGIVDACLNTGSVKVDSGVAKGIAGAFNGVATKVYNSVDVGTVTAPSGTGALMYHNPGYMYDGTTLRVYNVVSLDNIFIGRGANGTNPDAIVTAADGSTHENDTDDWNNAPAYKADSAAEAAWKVNKYYNSTYSSGKGQVFYTINDGVVAFGTADNQVRKITLAGEASDAIYAPQGSVVDLTEYVLVEYIDADSYSSDEVTVAEDNTFTVPASDVTITVKYTDAAIAAAKADLKELIDLYSKYDLDLLDGTSTVGSWLTAANAAWANEDATYTEVFAQVVAADTIVIKLVEGAKPVYSKVDLYKDYNAANDWSITTEDDWIRLTEDYEGKNGNPTLYVTNNIEFTKNMLPLCYGAEFSGTIHGNNWIFKNIKIEMTGGTAGNQGVSLIAAGSFTIENLGITGEVTNTATSGAVRTAAFVAGSGYATLRNCWTAVDVTGFSNHASRAQYLGVFAPDPAQKDTITNCFNVGTVTATNNQSASVFYSYAANSTLTNSIDAGTINTTSAAKGSIVSHPNGFTTANAIGNNASVNNDLWYLISAQDMSNYIVQLPGSQNACDTLADVNAYYRADSIGAAAYKVNAGAEGAVYYKLDATYGLAYGTVDTQVRKVTFKQDGQADIVTYVNQGDTLNVDQFGGFGALSTYTVGGVAIDASYEVPANDIEVVVTSTIPDGYTAAVNTLNGITETYAKYLSAKKAAEILSNYAEIEAAKTLIENTIAATEGSNESATYQAVIDLAGSHVVLTQVVSGKVPYEAKADYPATTEYGIYDEADWNAFAAGGVHSGETFYLMNNITLTAEETVQMTKFSGTLEGQGKSISGIKITTPINGYAALIQTLNGTVRNLTVNGDIDVTIGSAEDYVDNFKVGGIAGMANGATITGCTNNVAIKVVGYVGNSNTTAIGGVAGQQGVVANSTNNGKLDVTLHLEGSASRVFVGGIDGRIRDLGSDNNTNNGDIEVTIHGQSGSVWVAGIGSDGSGASAENCRNTGDITVTGGCYTYISGLFGLTYEPATLVNGTNEGNIIYTGREGENNHIVSANGIAGGVGVLDIGEGTVTNSGNITVSATNAAQAYAYGIAGQVSAAESFSAANSGNVWIGGIESGDANHKVAEITPAVEGLTITDTDANGSAIICDHSDSTYTHTEGHHTHTQACNVEGCGYVKETIPCVVDSWTWDTVEGEEYSHSATCTLCKEVYHEACTYEINEHNENCTLDSVVEFTCFCGREDITLEDTGCDGHTYDESKWAVDPDNANYEINTCTCDGCEGVAYRVAEAAKGNANGDEKVDLIDAILTLREVAGLNGEHYDEDGNTLSGEPGAEGTKIVFYFAFGNMDGDEKISPDDAVLIVRKWLKTV